MVINSNKPVNMRGSGGRSGGFGGGRPSYGSSSSSSSSYGSSRSSYGSSSSRSSYGSSRSSYGSSKTSSNSNSYNKTPSGSGSLSTISSVVSKPFNMLAVAGAGTLGWLLGRSAMNKNQSSSLFGDSIDESDDNNNSYNLPPLTHILSVGLVSIPIVSAFYFYKKCGKTYEKQDEKQDEDK